MKHPVPIDQRGADDPRGAERHPTPRIACLFVPDFAIAALERADPALRDVPLALADRSGPRATIIAVSAAAVRHGVRTGLTAAQGTAICAALVLRTLPGEATPGAGSPACTPDGAAAGHGYSVDPRRAAQAALCEVALSCSPRIEDASAGDPRGYGIVYLDAGGAPFPSEPALGAALGARATRIGLETRIGIGSTKLAAYLAARHGDGVTVVAPGAERRFLAPLPVACLEPDPEIAAVLARWGIARLGALACLSPAAMGARLGATGAVLVRRARGEDTAPLVTRAVPAVFEEEIALEYALDTLEPLIFVLRGCLDRLAARLGLRGLACGGLRLALGLADRARDERAIVVAAPTNDVKTLLTLTRLHLENAPPAAAVEMIRLAAEPVAARAAQLDLYRPAGPAPEQLATTIARLAAICGAERVGAPTLVDSHRPDAIALAPFEAAARSRAGAGALSRTDTRPRMDLQRAVDVTTAQGRAPRHHVPADAPCPLALRMLRPPRHVDVLDDGGRPDFVRGERIGGRVVALSGPWRLAGEWWSEHRFARDYYDMSLTDGGVYRLYRDRRTGAWFVEGEYD